jgi:hypothetical protein
MTEIKPADNADPPARDASAIARLDHVVSTRASEEARHGHDLD